MLLVGLGYEEWHSRSAGEVVIGNAGGNVAEFLKHYVSVKTLSENSEIYSIGENIQN